MVSEDDYEVGKHEFQFFTIFLAVALFSHFLLGPIIF
jgi:hypothetical protein